MKLKDLNIQWKRNLAKAILGAIIVAILPLYIFKNITIFMQYIGIVFPGVFIGCMLVDLTMRLLN